MHWRTKLISNPSETRRVQPYKSTPASNYPDPPTCNLSHPSFAIFPAALKQPLGAGGVSRPKNPQKAERPTETETHGQHAYRKSIIAREGGRRATGPRRARARRAIRFNRRDTVRSRHTEHGGLRRFHLKKTCDGIAAGKFWETGWGGKVVDGKRSQEVDNEGGMELLLGSRLGFVGSVRGILKWEIFMYKEVMRAIKQ